MKLENKPSSVLSQLPNAPSQLIPFHSFEFPELSIQLSGISLILILN
jgi:hypothetical protein